MTAFDEMAPERVKPGRKGVTAEQVFAAADSIRASRREPTVDAVQKLLGTGSTGTVGTHLRTWRSGKDGMVPTAAIPDTMVKALQAFAESACADVSKQWQARMQPVLEDNMTLTETLTSLQEEKDRQADKVVQKRSERDELQGRCQQQAEEIQRLRDAELLARSEKTEAEVADAAVRQERDMQLRSLMSVEAELKAALRDRDDKAEELTRVKIELARMEARLESMFEREDDIQVRQSAAQRRPAAGRRIALMLKRIR